MDHLPGDVVCFVWETHTNNHYNKNKSTFLQNGVTPLLLQGQLLTCRFGPGVDKRSSAALPHLLIAGMDVNAVDCEGTQGGDF